MGTSPKSEYETEYISLSRIDLNINKHRYDDTSGWFIRCTGDRYMNPTIYTISIRNCQTPNGEACNKNHNNPSAKIFKPHLDQGN